jgi:KipI family sensor histidine kinase inhibitor
MNLNAPRIRDAGDSALLVEWEEVIDPLVNARAIAVAAEIRKMPPPGLRDVVSTFRSIAIFFDPLRADPDVFRDALTRVTEAPLEVVHGRTIEAPVAYGSEAGPDLDAVAEWAGLSPAAVADRHASAEYRVFMLGFLPGFAYLGSVDDRIAAPRHATPRLRVPAGSVGIAGRQTGIYPRDSAGGWQIIGRSPLQVFEPDKVPAALFKPGDTVRFVAISPRATSDTARPVRTRTDESHQSHGEINTRTVTVLRPGLFTTIQDQGRWGHQGSGVPVAGALDLVSHRIANLLVGNTADAATLEITLAGPELRMEQPARLAITGADLRPSIDGVPTAIGVVKTCLAGSILRFGDRRSGARSYIAFDGGIDTPLVLGSRATHIGVVLGGLDGRMLAAGDKLPLGRPNADPPRLPGSGFAVESAGGARLRVLPGPQEDFFAEEAFTLLERTRFLITPQSNRMAYRLTGGSLPRIRDREMISDAAFVGGVQVPASGEPILLMSDRQTTGGYPQIATVITADVPRAGQLAPGDWVEFARCTRAEAIAALRDQEAMLGGDR